jgi:hypothetical protein
MQALTLMIVYVLTTFTVQFLGFLISRLVDYEWPTLGLMTFLILFMGAFGLAWPIAVRLTEWLIRFRGYVVETEQSGGDARLDVARKRPLQLNGDRTKRKPRRSGIAIPLTRDTDTRYAIKVRAAAPPQRCPHS